MDHGELLLCFVVDDWMSFEKCFTVFSIVVNNIGWKAMKLIKCFLIRFHTTYKLFSDELSELSEFCQKSLGKFYRRIIRPQIYSERWFGVFENFFLNWWIIRWCGVTQKAWELWWNVQRDLSDSDNSDNLSENNLSVCGNSKYCH